METLSQESPPRYKVLFAVSGSVAAIKTLEIATKLREFCDVRIAVTKSALHFVGRENLPQDIEIFTDEDEWSNWKKMKDPVLHIELRRWADLLCIAPLSANTLAKISNGFCDNLVTCVARAWDFSKPFLVAPAMNTLMWDHPFTAQQLNTLKSLNIEIIPPISKTLACADVGMGAMAAVSTITSAIEQHVKKGTQKSLKVQ